MVQKGKSKIAKRLERKMKREQYRKDRIDYHKGDATRRGFLGGNKEIPWKASPTKKGFFGRK